MKAIREFLCWLLGHDPRAIESASWHEIVVYCNRCKATMYKDGVPQ